MLDTPPEQLFTEIDELLRSTPPRATIRHSTPENHSWFGRAAAAVAGWDSVEGVNFDHFLSQFNANSAIQSEEGLTRIMVLLNKARSNLRMRLVGPTSISIGQGKPFDYFDELRKVIELGQKELLVVDPYLDAEFVSQYLPHVHQGVPVRLLTTGNYLTKLLPAVDAYAAQSGTPVNVRTSNGLHDRYIIVDGSQCYQSGASFKDGAKKAPTTFTQINDAFAAVKQTYEDLWSAAKVER